MMRSILEKNTELCDIWDNPHKVMRSILSQMKECEDMSVIY
jgi:hypothetical protein